MPACAVWAYDKIFDGDLCHGSEANSGEDLVTCIAGDVVEECLSCFRVLGDLHDCCGHV